MINHVAIGPLPDGTFAAAYQTPGCNVMTTVISCVTNRQAIVEAERLNTEQLRKEDAIQYDRALRGFHRIASDLKDM